MKYDIFISYRREGGDTLAQLIYDRLTHRGYRVFLDIESLNAGKFNEKLLSVIEECKDVIVILPPHALDRCVNEGDWVLRELEHSIQLSKNIIPVMMKGFSWPDNLPDSIAEICNYNGILDNKDYFDAVIDKIENLMNSKPAIFGGALDRLNAKSTSVKVKAKKRKRLLLGLAAGVLAAAGAVGLFMHQSEQTKLLDSTMVKITLTASEEMSASEYYDAIDIIEKRIDILADGHDYVFEDEQDQINIQIPYDVFEGIDIATVLKCYVSRPGKICFSVPDANLDEEDYYFPVDRSAISKVEFMEEDVSAIDIDFSKYELQGLEDGENCKILAVTLEDAVADELRAWADTKGFDTLYLFQDCQEHELDYYYYLNGDLTNTNTIYLVDNYQFDNIVKLVEYNYSHETFVSSLYYNIELPAIWETEADAAFGQNQCNEQEIPEPYVRINYKTYDTEISEGEVLDTASVWKSRLDTLGTPYALGSVVGEENSVSVKIHPKYVTDQMVDLISMGKGINVICNYDTMLSSYYVESVEVVEREDGTFGLHIIPSSTWNPNDEEWIDFLQEEDNVYLYTSDSSFQLDKSTLGEAFDGESFWFDSATAFGLEEITEETVYLYHLIQNCATGAEWPVSYYFQDIYYKGFEDLNEFERLNDNQKEEDLLMEEALYSVLSQQIEVNEEDILAYDSGRRFNIRINLEQSVDSLDKMTEILQSLYESDCMSDGNCKYMTVAFCDGSTEAFSWAYVSFTRYDLVAYEEDGYPLMDYSVMYGEDMQEDVLAAIENMFNEHEFYQNFTVSDSYKTADGRITFVN